MPLGRSRRVRGRSARAGWLGLLWLCGACSGTEHAVFQLGVPSVAPPAPRFDAGPPPRDAALPPAKLPVVPVIEDDAGGVTRHRIGPDPGLDPTVTFAWKESLPGQGTCKAGRYVGSFTCTVEGKGVPDPAPTLSGAVTFTLSGSPEEQLLSIMEGSISGPLYGGGLDGKLDCLAKHFAAMSVDGTAIVGQGKQNVLALFPAFNATLDGVFDDQALVISGSLMMVNDAGQMCRGQFHASATP
jgi:hypothetical protein